MKRETRDDICLGDRFIRNGMEYTIMAFHGESRVLVQGNLDEDDHYTFRDEKLLNDINNYVKK